MMTDFNELVHKVSLDADFLNLHLQPVAKTDEFQVTHTHTHAHTHAHTHTHTHTHTHVSTKWARRHQFSKVFSILTLRIPYT